MILFAPWKRTVSNCVRRASQSVLPLALAAFVIPSAQAQLSPSAQKQIAEIYAFKATFTPAEKKMSTNLILASRLAAGKPIGNLARFLDPTPRDAEGQLEVEVTGYMTPSLLSSPAMLAVEKTDGLVPSAVLTTGHARVRVHDTDLLTLAGHSDVKSIREATTGHTNVGSVTSQGYIAHGANQLIASGITGAGVKVGVMSDSATPSRVAALIASGDLPSDVVVVPGQQGPATGENEGTAMMEIVHDIAPGAKLFFATAGTGSTQFAANIRTLRFTYGCDIIVDDYSYFAESVFQDGFIADAVNDVTKDGALYFSSAANSGNLSSGTSGTWEGDFTIGGVSGANITNLEGGAVYLNNFALNGSKQAYDTLTSPARSGIWLHWSDPNAGSSNDYDLFVLDSTGTNVKGFSGFTQDGTQDPLEYVYPSSTCGSAKPTGYCPATGDRIVIALYNGEARALHIDTERATVSIGTSGATFGHNAAANTFTAAAVYWDSGRRGVRPFVGGASNPIETFSSDGDRKIFYNPDGSPITPGNFLFSTNGGLTLQKPDAAAADGVITRTPGFNPFFGTSAAAPHAAAIAALVKSAVPTLTNTQIRQALIASTIDDMEPGVDRDSGYGILIAPAAVKAAQAMAGPPSLKTAQPIVSSAAAAH